MTCFDFDNYKKFVRARIEQMPKNGYGQYSKMANFLAINAVNVTQVFRGDRDLTVEQACLLIDFLGLSDLEGQYFVGLVEHARAGHHKLKELIEKRLAELNAKSQNLKERIAPTAQLGEEAKAVFYSNWYYSGIRLASSIPALQSADEIAAYFQIPLPMVNRVIEFLLAHGLCKETNGRIVMGPSVTHIEASSPLIGRHHANWRNKAIERVSFLNADELALSMPCSISAKSRVLIRKELVDAIERITQLIDKSPEEELACLNIDWIRI